MAGKQELKFGILGFGSIGQRHYFNLVELGYEVMAYDPRDKRIEHWDREAVIDWADAVLVCSPSQYHADDLMDVINAGKHCFVEKPFGFEAPVPLDRFLQSARSRSPELVIATGFNLRFHHAVIEAKRRIGDLGRIKDAKFTVLQKTEKPPYLRDGIIRNWCSHELDLAEYLLGPLEVEDCHATLDKNLRDTNDCLITLNNDPWGVSSERWPFKVHIEADYYTEPEQRYFWIQGTEATIYADLIARTLRIIRSNGVESYFPFTDSFDQNYVDEIKLFALLCENNIHAKNGKLASGEDGVKNLYQICSARKFAGVS